MNIRVQSMVNLAIETVPGFSNLLQRVKQKMSITGVSPVTFKNYSTPLAKISLHFKKLPIDLSIQEIEGYLYFIQQKYKSLSDSYFKFTIYSLRFLFKMCGLNDKHIQLPIIKNTRKLPIVLSKQEVVKLINKPTLIKHRILIAILYGCGLRCFEARNIRLNDIDFHRAVLFVRQGKGKKDRYVPLGNFLIRELKNYIELQQPRIWLFNGMPNGRAGGDFDSRYSQKGVQFVVQTTATKAGITKAINVHTLRHTFATHLLEDGLDIVSIKELLGHARIETTLIYLHVAQMSRKNNFSPLDNLEGLQLINGVQSKINFEG
ncbi:MAG: tyrosine-type recombinase/integrase [Bacteroidia bacterium]